MNLLLMIRSVVDSFSFGSLVDIFSQSSQDLSTSKWTKIFSVFAGASPSKKKSQSGQRLRRVRELFKFWQEGSFNALTQLI